MNESLLGSARQCPERLRHKVFCETSEVLKTSEVFRFLSNHPMASNNFTVGDRVKIFLDSKYWQKEGWFEGTIIRIDPYSEHRSFYWVELDVEVQPLRGGKTGTVSVLNPKNIVRL